MIKRDQIVTAGFLNSLAGIGHFTSPASGFRGQRAGRLTESERPFTFFVRNDENTPSDVIVDWDIVCPIMDLTMREHAFTIFHTAIFDVVSGVSAVFFHWRRLFNYWSGFNSFNPKPFYDDGRGNIRQDTGDAFLDGQILFYDNEFFVSTNEFEQDAELLAKAEWNEELKTWITTYVQKNVDIQCGNFISASANWERRAP